MSDEAARTLALLLKWRMADVRGLMDELEASGVHVQYIPTTGDLCPCTYHYATESGLCVKCETDREVARQKERDEAERERLANDTERRINAAKKARERMRRRHLANPRDTEAKEMLRAVDEFIALMEEPDEWEEMPDEM